jgi:hypothetical protein
MNLEADGLKPIVDAAVYFLGSIKQNGGKRASHHVFSARPHLQNLTVPSSQTTSKKKNDDHNND